MIELVVEAGLGLKPQVFSNKALKCFRQWKLLRAVHFTGLVKLLIKNHEMTFSVRRMHKRILPFHINLNFISFFVARGISPSKSESNKTKWP